MRSAFARLITTPSELLPPWRAAYHLGCGLQKKTIIVIQPVYADMIDSAIGHKQLNVGGLLDQLHSIALSYVNSKNTNVDCA